MKNRRAYAMPVTSVWRSVVAVVAVCETSVIAGLASRQADSGPPIRDASREGTTTCRISSDEKEERRRWESNPRWRICNPLP